MGGVEVEAAVRVSARTRRRRNGRAGRWRRRLTRFTGMFAFVAFAGRRQCDTASGNDALLGVTRAFLEALRQCRIAVEPGRCDIRLLCGYSGRPRRTGRPRTPRGSGRTLSAAFAAGSRGALFALWPGWPAPRLPPQRDDIAMTAALEHGIVSGVAVAGGPHGYNVTRHGVVIGIAHPNERLNLNGFSPCSLDQSGTLEITGVTLPGLETFDDFCAVLAHLLVAEKVFDLVGVRQEVRLRLGGVGAEVHAGLGHDHFVHRIDDAVVLRQHRARAEEDEQEDEQIGLAVHLLHLRDEFQAGGFVAAHYQQRGDAADRWGIEVDRATGKLTFLAVGPEEHEVDRRRGTGDL